MAAACLGPGASIERAGAAATVAGAAFTTSNGETVVTVTAAGEKAGVAPCHADGGIEEEPTAAWTLRASKPAVTGGLSPQKESLDTAGWLLPAPATRAAIMSSLTLSFFRCFFSFDFT